MTVGYSHRGGGTNPIPIAVRLVVETEDGRSFDWLFEVDGVVREY